MEFLENIPDKYKREVIQLITISNVAAISKKKQELINKVRVFNNFKKALKDVEDIDSLLSDMDLTDKEKVLAEYLNIQL